VFPLILVFVLSGSTIVACQPAGTTLPSPEPSSQATPTELNVRLDQDFTLRLGQSALISDENLRVRFASVLEDSRCPKNVACVWEGQARIVLIARYRDVESPQLTATIMGVNPQNDSRLVDWSGYTFTFKALDPYPGDTGPKTDVRVTLALSKK